MFINKIGNHGRAIVVVLMTYLILLNISWAEVWSDQAKLIAFDGAADDEFGCAVAIDGDYAVVGAKYDDDHGSDSGAAYIYHFDGTAWTQQAKLTPADGATGDSFGCAVALSGDYAIVGAHLDTDMFYGSNCGSAYIYKRDGTIWTLQVKLYASDGAANDEFGFAVSIDGDYAIVGARYNDDGGSSSGSAYIFHRDGTLWPQQAKLTASDAGINAYFGRTVCIRGEYVVVGAPGDDEFGTAAGAAYVFKRDATTWPEQAKLTANDADHYDKFGYSVAADGERISASCFQDDYRGTDSGSVYIFEYDGINWTQSAKLTASDGAAGDKLGASVGLRGDYVIAGAYEEDDEASNAGAVYVFHFNGIQWKEQDKLTACEGAADDNFGLAAAISNEHILVGAYHDDDKGGNSGSVYLFRRVDAGWVQQDKCTAADGADSDMFGISVAVNGAYAVIGATGDDDKGDSSGSAYVFKQEGDKWTQQAKLTASDGAAGDNFGTAVDIHGYDIIAGADRKETFRGTAYIFKYNGTAWIQQAKLTAPDSATSDFFGWSVSICGDYAIVGALYHVQNGAAYIFKRSYTTVWTPQVKLTASDGAQSDRFGTSVSIDGDYAIVGADGNDDGGEMSGSAYIFRRNGTNWIEQCKLTASDPNEADSFGISVAISGDCAVIGADRDSELGVNTGAAYIFRRNTEDPNWSQEAKLTASDAKAGDCFGSHVAVDGGYVIIGTFNYISTDNTKAYLFKHTGDSWTQQAILAAPDVAAVDGYGCGVSISGQNAVVGVWGSNDKGVYSGSAYFFERLPFSADLNGDGHVNLIDLAVTASQWLQFE